MTSLILSPAKVVAKTSANKWQEATGGDAVLITSQENIGGMYAVGSQYKTAFKEILFFSNYSNNDQIILEVIQKYKKYKFSKIIHLTEIDVLRAALLRKHLGLPGQSSPNALLFRDKWLMKKACEKVGIPVAKHALISSAIDVQKFVDETGYPIVIKPLNGRGAAGTYVINGEKEFLKLLSDGLLQSGNGASLLVEKFLKGDMYRIDGLVRKEEILFISTAKYWGTHLEYLEGGSLGSYILPQNSDLHVRLIAFTKRLLTSALPLEDLSLVHIEVFVEEKSEDIILGEAASRLGGGSINEEIGLSYGIDLKMEYIKRSQEVTSCLIAQNQKQLAGQLHIAPKVGRLKQTPTHCPFSWVDQFGFLGVLGREYSLMEFTNDEISWFTFVGDNEQQLEKRLNILSTWMQEEMVWEGNYG